LQEVEASKVPEPEFDRKLTRMELAAAQSMTMALPVLQRAFELTDEAQKHNLTRTFGDIGEGRFEKLVRKEVDFRPEAMTDKRMALDYDAFRISFKETLNEVKDYSQLRPMLEGFIRRELDMLFFDTNNLLGARINRRFVDAYLDNLVTIFTESGKAEMQALAEELSQLKKAYALGFEAYDYLRSDMLDETGETCSLVAHAEQLLDETEQAGDMPEEAEELDPFVRRHAMAFTSYAELLDKVHYFTIDADEFGPLYLLIGRYCETLAETRLMAAQPTVNFADPKVDSTDAYMEEYGSILNGCIERLKEDDSLANFVRVAQDLRSQIKAENHLDQGIIAKAHLGAEKAARKNFSEHLREYVRTLSIPQPSSSSFVGGMYPNFHTPMQLNADFDEFMESAKDLEQAYSKKTLLDYMNNMVLGAMRDVMLRGYHPACLLAVRDYVAEFSDQICEALAQSGHKDVAFFDQMTDLEHFVMHAYQATRAMGDWVMETSAGGYDNLYDRVWTIDGLDPRRLSPTENDDLVERAKDFYKTMAQEMGMPPFLQGELFLPYLYARCQAIADLELENEAFAARADSSPKGGALWVERVAAKPAASVATPENQEDAHDPAQQRTRKIMTEAINRITPDDVLALCQKDVEDGKEIEEMPPQISSHTMAILDEYFNARLQKAERIAQRNKPVGMLH
jgi:hypothetical protein